MAHALDEKHVARDLCTASIQRCMQPRSTSSHLSWESSFLFSAQKDVPAPDLHLMQQGARHFSLFNFSLFDSCIAMPQRCLREQRISRRTEDPQQCDVSVVHRSFRAVPYGLHFESLVRSSRIADGFPCIQIQFFSWIMLPK